jgi:hypothetical protein
MVDHNILLHCLHLTFGLVAPFWLVCIPSHGLDSTHSLWIVIVNQFLCDLQCSSRIHAWSDTVCHVLGQPTSPHCTPQHQCTPVCRWYSGLQLLSACKEDQPRWLHLPCASMTSPGSAAFCLMLTKLSWWGVELQRCWADCKLHQSSSGLSCFICQFVASASTLTSARLWNFCEALTLIVCWHFTGGPTVAPNYHLWWYFYESHSTCLELSASQHDSSSVTKRLSPSAQIAFVQTIISITTSPLTSLQVQGIFLH